LAGKTDYSLADRGLFVRAIETALSKLPWSGGITLLKDDLRALVRAHRPSEP